MKKSFFSHVLMASIVLFFLPGQSRGQVLIPATGTDIYMFTTPSGTLTHLEAAILSYDASPVVNGSIIAIAAYGNGYSGGLYVADPGPSGSSYYMALGIPNPDVIIGDDVSNPGTGFYVAVANTGIGGSYIDFYYAGYTASYTFTLTPTPVATTTLTGAYGVRLDAVATDQNVLTTGYPLTDRYVVTWFDVSNDIHVDIASFSSIPATMPTGAAYTWSGAGGIQPDVAGVERYNAATGGVEEVALVSFKGASPGELYFADYNFSAGGSSGIIMLDDCSFSTCNTINNVRIDAVDNSQVTTAWWWSGASEYKVVAEVDNTVDLEIRTYDNILYLAGLGSSFWTSSSVDDVTTLSGYSGNPPPYNHFAPSVAAQVDYANEPNFLVSHGTLITGTDAVVLMEPIDATIQSAIDFAPSSSQEYYLVNTAYPLNQNGYIPNAIATPANNQDGYKALSTWSTNNAGNFDVYYKISDITGGSKYNYRPSAQDVAQGTRKKSVAYPNPATDRIYINTSECGYMADNYKITDMTGRIVQKGAIVKATPISIAGLMPGIYILNIMENNKCMDRASITKQ